MSINPKVLEVQWAPDCAQATEDEPMFWNEILEALYMDKHIDNAACKIVYPL
jgi:hypothetical protein